MEESSNSAHPAWGAASPEYIDASSSHQFRPIPNYLDIDMGQLRSTRLANGRTLIIVVALLTQIVVLAFVALIMGIAVLTMCAVLGELFVVTIVAAVLERQIVTISDLATLMEVTATFLVTIITVVLAAIGGTGKIVDGSAITATKLG